jgi:hypothetical protein
MAPAGLHLVGDPQHAVFREDFAERRVEPVGRGGEPADALHRFGDQRGRGADVAEQVPQVGDAGGGEDVVVQAGVGAAVADAAVDVEGLQRRERRGRPAAVAGDGDGGEGPAVVAVAHGQDLVAAPVGGGEQQGGVVGLGAGGGEEDAGVGDAGQGGDPLGEVDHRPVEVERGGVRQPAGLVGDRPGDLGEGVGGHGGEDAAEEVEVAAALGVPHVAALAAGDLEGVVVVEAEPVGEDGAVPAEQCPGAGGRVRHGSTSPW